VATEDPFSHLIISRKRKLYKFANFNSYSNCFDVPRDSAAKLSYARIVDYLPQSSDDPRKLIVEIAAGNAQFSLALARLHPECNFIAVDIKSDRLYTSARQATQQGVSNIAFVRMNLAELSRLLPARSVSELWLTFPDPFPKKRSAKHRLSHPSFLAQYEAILKQDGLLKYKTDNIDLFKWSLEQLVAQKWRLNELSFDLHESDLSDEYKIKTYYEERFTGQGLPISYCTATN